MLKPLTKMQKLHRWAVAAAVMTGSALLGFNCAPFQQSGSGFSESASSGIPTSAEPQLPVALLTSEQILKAMISATGVEGFSEPTAIDDLISRTYTERAGSLPSTQSLKETTSPMLISVANLASTICAKAVSREIATGEAQRQTRLFFREMDFSRGLAGQSSDSVSHAFHRLARNAWRREATSQEENSIVQFAQEYSMGARTDDPEQTRLLAVSVCTAVLTSFDALTF